MQQINLYLPEFQPKQDILNFNQLLIAVAAMLLLYVALGLWMQSDTQLLHQQLKQREQMLIPLEKQKAELEQMMAQRPDSGQLDFEMAAVEQDIQNKSIALNTLKHSDIAASKGFSQLLLDLAQHNDRRLWFTQIELKHDVLALHGQTVDPELITRWIENTAQRSQLARQFSAIRITQNDNDRRVYDFELSGGVLIRYE
jgi:Tfp pilus assembly protein PilN